MADYDAERGGGIGRARRPLCSLNSSRDWKEVKRGFRLSLTARGDQDGGRADALKSPALPRLQSHDTTDQRSPKEAHILRNKIDSSESKFSCVFVVVFRARTPDLPNIYYSTIYLSIHMSLDDQAGL
jgi:hypothetical protein